MDDTFGRRKAEVQDILSSFSRDTLPTEFRPELLARIDKDQGRRPPTEWTIPGDLEGSLLQWGVHDEECYNLLQRAQPAGTRFVLFNQKIARRLRAELHRCAEIDRSASSIEIRAEVNEISENLRSIVAASWSRQVIEGKASPAGPFVETLNEICRHRERADNSRHPKRASASHPEARLFNMLVVGPRADQGHFLLDLLDWVADNFIETLRPHTDALDSLAGHLAGIQAPKSYRKKFQEIIDKVKVDEQRS